MAKTLVEMGRVKCPRGKVTRVAYTRKDGVHVREGCVPHKGRFPGKAPASKRWFPRDTKPLGWRKDMPASERHSLLRRKVAQEGCLPIGKALRARANVTTDRETEKKMRADERWLYRQGFCRLQTKK